MKKYIVFAAICLTQNLFSQTDLNVVPEQVPYSSEIDIAPEYPGGIANFYTFIAANFVAPENSKLGKAVLTFVVEKDGTLTHIKIIKNTSNRKFGKEAIRVLRLSPKWMAGEKDGKKVSVLYSIPINCATMMEGNSAFAQ
jgi:protein TonB